MFSPLFLGLSWIQYSFYRARLRHTQPSNHSSWMSWIQMDHNGRCEKNSKNYFSKFNEKFQELKRVFRNYWLWQLASINPWAYLYVKCWVTRKRWRFSRWWGQNRAWIWMPNFGRCFKNYALTCSWTYSGMSCIFILYILFHY